MEVTQVSLTPNSRQRVSQSDCRGVTLTLVLPAFNEADSIEQAVVEAYQALMLHTSRFEILVVDDGSTDETPDLVERLASCLDSVRLLRQPRNQGYGAALRRGFQEATCDLVAFTDADCQFDLRELDRLILLAQNYEVVCGYRIDRQDAWHRKFYSKSYNTLVRTLLGTGVRDCDCALKVFHREAIQNLPIESDTFFVNAEVLARARQARFRIAEVGVTHRPRFDGESTVSLKHVFPVGAALLRFWWNEVLCRPDEMRASETGPGWSASRQLLGTLVLFVAAAMMFLTNLSYPLIEPDESRYAQIPLTMLASGDWVTPRLDNEPYLDKPPLLYWLTALSYQAFGTNEMAARLPGAIAALLTVLATFLLGQKLLGSRAAWCGAITLLLSAGFVLSGRFILMDGPLTLFTTMTFLCCAAALKWPHRRAAWLLAAGTACGFGVLTKGPVAPVLCIPPFLAACWLHRGPGRLTWRDAAAFIAPQFAINLPWFIAITVAHAEFGAYFFWKHHIVRFTNAFDHREPWWFYLPVLLAGMFPASLLLPSAFVFLFSRNSGDRAERSESFVFLMFSAIWVIGFFSLSSCKLPTYILPALPLLCLGMGWMLDRTVLADRLNCISQRTANWLALFPKRATLAVLFAGMCVIAVDTFVWSQNRETLFFDYAIGAAMLGSFLFVLRCEFTNARTAWSLLAVFGLIGVGFTFGDFLPEIAQERSIHRTASLVQETHPESVVAYFGYDSHSAEMHLGRHEFTCFGKDDLERLSDFVQSHPQTVVVSSPAFHDLVQQACQGYQVTEIPGGRDYVQLLTSATTR